MQYAKRSGAAGRGDEFEDSFIGIAPSRSQGKHLEPHMFTGLNALEADIMDIVWSSNAPLEQTIIIEGILVQRRKELDETVPVGTIAGTIRRLNQRGLLSYVKDGRKSLYSPTVSREQMVARMFNDVTRKLLGNSISKVFTNLLGRAAKPSAKSANAQQDQSDQLDALMQALESASGNEEK